MTSTAYDAPRFVDLPPSTYNGGTERIDWLALAAPCRDHPGEWAALGTIGDRQSFGHRKCRFTAAGFEVTTRTNGDGTRTVYARYVGPVPVAPAASSSVAQATAQPASVAVYGEPLLWRAAS